jgi:hypothetical protein
VRTGLPDDTTFDRTAINYSKKSQSSLQYLRVVILHLFDRFSSFPEWRSYEVAVKEFSKNAVAYREALKTAFGPNFPKVISDSYPSLTSSQFKIQQHISMLISAHNECDKLLWCVMKSIDVLEEMHERVTERELEERKIQNQEKEAVMQVNKAEQCLKTSSNSTALRTAQQVFDSALAREQECKRAYDKSSAEFRKLKKEYEREFACTVAQNLEEMCVIWHQQFQKCAKFGNAIQQAATEIMEMSEDKDDVWDETEKLRKIIKKKEIRF